MSNIQLQYAAATSNVSMAGQKKLYSYTNAKVLPGSTEALPSPLSTATIYVRRSVPAMPSAAALHSARALLDHTRCSDCRGCEECVVATVAALLEAIPSQVTPFFAGDVAATVNSVVDVHTNEASGIAEERSIDLDIHDSPSDFRALADNSVYDGEEEDHAMSVQETMSVGARRVVDDGGDDSGDDGSFENAVRSSRDDDDDDGAMSDVSVLTRSGAPVDVEVANGAQRQYLALRPTTAALHEPLRGVYWAENVISRFPEHLRGVVGTMLAAAADKPTVVERSATLLSGATGGAVPL